MCFVLQTLNKAGYSIALEQLGHIDGLPVWNLKYAAATQPVARIGSQAWVYFQFKATSHLTMPDFAIFDNDSARTPALAVFDAKYSELRGYGLSSYSGTLTKYEGLGGKNLVLEYEDREDLKQQPDVLFGVRPKSPGAERLKAELFGTFVSPATPAVAVIDRSPSFREFLPGALGRVRDYASLKLLQDRYVVFGSTAEIRSGLIEDIRDNKIESDAVSGTRLVPLMAVLNEIRSSEKRLTILVVSDTKFQDGCLDELRHVADAVWTLGAQEQS